MVVDLAKRMEMAVVNTFSKKRQEHRMTFIKVEIGGHRWTTSCIDNVT